MLPTFVIGLREGLEAALIVGIIAAFLRKQGRRDLLVWVMVGVVGAIGLCLGAGIALEIYSKNLPQRQQEGLETIIGALAVCMVTYMVIWMRRHSRQLKGQLEGLAADAIAGHSKAGRAMVLMAFLAVIREGLETVVFLLAAFNETGSTWSAGLGACLGIVVAIGLGYGIYRGGVHLNLSKFFRATGLVLVLVAAGLVVNALHTAHEAGWLNSGQGPTVDLSWLVKPGTVQASLLTGMLGIQDHPVVIEVIGWLVYLIPVGCYVAWPPGRPAPARTWSRVLAGFGALAAVAAVLFATLAPARPPQRPTTTGRAITAQVMARGGSQAVLRTERRQPVAGSSGPLQDVTLRAAGSARTAGLITEVYRAVLAGSGSAGRPTVLSAGRVAVLNGGRLPIGIPSTAHNLAVSYHDSLVLTAWLDIRTDRVVNLSWAESVTAEVRSQGLAVALADPIATARVALPAATVADAVAAARSDHADLDRRSQFGTLAIWFAVLAGLALLGALGLALAARRRLEPVPVTEPNPAGALVRS